ncbi:MAG TPA: hypothetical protein VHR38_07785 [Solirubrobacterales bacterium]|jgi:hypothetical protein|nr:hypothetical protein [Solirubrobacterales bacterium]
MNRKITTLGVVLASVFATSVIGASAAFAQEFHSAVHPQSIHGTPTTAHVFTTNAGTFTCKKITFSGTTSGATSTTMTLAPDYNECTAFGFINVPIHENGCDFKFSSHVPPGTVEILCPTGKVIEITAPFCTTTIGPQHLTGMTYANNAGKTDIIATANITGVHYVECGTTRTNGVLKGTTTWTGSAAAIWWE